MFKIKELREQKGISQEQLSEKANVNRSLLSQLENNKLASTTTETLQKLANALECRITDLFI